MAVPNPPDAIHGKAIDLACEDDRVWFEQNQERGYRLREVEPFEFNGPIGDAPAGMTRRVLVAQAEAGVRFRTPVGLPASLPTEGASDAHLAQIFDQVASPEIKRALELAKHLKGKK